MKKIALTLFSTALILGASTSAFAEEPSKEGKGTFNFGQMKEMMEEMHPGLSNEELKNMYNHCHGTNGAMPSNNFEMMNHEQMKIVD